MIAAGGTGGHVYPALAVAEALIERRPDIGLTFVGGVGDFARSLVETANLPFEHYDEVRSGPLHGVPFTTVLNSLVQIGVGSVQALRLIRRRKPSALLLTGGWVGLPIALAARLFGVPSLIYLPDIEPGLTIKMLRFIANRVAITAPDSERYFRRRQTIVTGYPVRRGMIEAARGDGRTRGMTFFRLHPARKTLLVFGGSRGARSINHALLAILPDLLEHPVQVIHVTGTLDWEQDAALRAALTAQHADLMQHYHAFPYLHDEMALAFACADLVLSRSGASILGEFPLFGLPSVLVPYPYAWRYQKVNADYLAARGAALVLDDQAMSSDLLPTLRALLIDDPLRLQSMQRASHALATRDAPDAAPGDGAWNTARELLRLSGVQA
jgi:UDP-N-acetylglucosamine--N-acetylmuramyl-(pentapeptide) pyrophosphoryl-undecaprenol N-acetylglucosamine transferase